MTVEPSTGIVGKGLQMQLKYYYVLILTLILSGCNLALPTQPALSIEAPRVQPAKVSEITAGDLNQSCICERVIKTNAYMRIANTGWTADRLTRVETDAALVVEFQQTGLVESLASPEVLEAVEIPARGQASFTPGSYSMVLKDLKKDLNPGDPVQLTLYFEKSGPLVVDTTVQE